MNPDLNKLQDYPFTRLGQLLKNSTPPSEKDLINLSIGEPKHAAPPAVLATLRDTQQFYSSYPKTKGIDALRNCIAEWLNTRFNLNPTINPHTQVLPVNGTREALFAFAQSCIDRSQKDPLVICPNPFYQIYEGAALLAGAKPYFVPGDSRNQYIPAFDQLPKDILQRCQLMYLCSPGNPSGAVMSLEQLKRVVQLAHQHDFIIAGDECYSEIYTDQPPVGLLQACSELGIDDYKRCIVFHSLSKRSNLPGLRSGFVAGDAEILNRFLLYRTYHGCAMPESTQHASISAWSDEQHVKQNRALYAEKFSAVTPVLQSVVSFKAPSASFYIWLPTPICDIEFAAQLFAQQHVKVLPGSFLSREVNGKNPGSRHVRIALVASKQECVVAAQRIVDFMRDHKYN